MLDALVDGIEPLARQAGNAAILVPRALEKPPQRFGRPDALGRCAPHGRVLGGQRHVHQYVLVGDAIERGAATFLFFGVQRDLRANVVAALRRSEDASREHRIRRCRGHLAQGGRDGAAHALLRFGPQCLGECSGIIAVQGRCGAHVGRRIGAQQLHDRLRIPRQRRDSDDALRRVGVLMQRSSKDLVEHVVAWLDDG